MTKPLATILLIIIIFLPFKIINAVEYATTTVSLTVSATGVCGDGAIDAGEICDDGNTTDCDGCKGDCSRADNVCGDSIVECGETCDGNSQSCVDYNGDSGTQSCNSTCNGWGDCSVTATPAGGVNPEIANQINIYNILVTTKTNEAKINWLTNKEAYCSIKWGETQELMDGQIQNSQSKIEHQAYLINLIASTNYYYQIICTDNTGHRAETLLQIIRTKDLPDQKPPANISDFLATPDIDKIILTWKNPLDEDFQGVKILKSEKFYPLDINEGEEIYDDSGETIIDYNVEVGRRYYYTGFAYDNNGNYASGAITSAVIGEEIISPFPEIPWAPAEELIEVNIGDFDFLVANNTIQIGTVAIENEEKLFSLLPGTILGVRTERENFPEVLKSIILTIVPRGDASLKEKMLEAKSYLLRKENDFFTTTITSPIKIKDYDFFLSILNLGNAMIARAEGLLDVEYFGKVIQSKLLNIAAKPVYASELTLYSIDENKFKKWEGYNFSQFNPIYSNKLGDYGFLVPNGRYLIKAKKNNFFSYTSLPFEVKNNLVNQEIELIYYPIFNRKLFIILVIVLFVIYKITRDKLIKKSNKKINTIIK